MRAQEFITVLFEYQRAHTARNHGDRLMTTLGKTPASFLPDSLYNLQTLIIMVSNPERYTQGIALDLFGKTVLVNADNAVEVLARLKPQIIEAILFEIESRDPTTNKEYTQWLARAWINSAGRLKFEDMNRNDLLTAYTLGKRRRLIGPEHADINQFKTWEGFENTILRNYNIDLLYGSEKEDPRRGNANTVYEDNTVRVIVPNDEAAACYYGRGTRWCTASTRGHNYFNRYNRDGKLYILLPKNPEYDGEKYQLHFGSEQFMDEADDPINLRNLLYRRFPDLLEYFKTEEPAMSNFIVFADDSVLKPIIDKIAKCVEYFMWERINWREEQDDEWHYWKAEQARELGYLDKDGDIDWELVNDDPNLNDYLNFNEDARELVFDTMDSVKLTPKEVRKLADNITDEYGNEDMPPIGRIEYIIADNIGNQGNDMRTKVKLDVNVRYELSKWEVYYRNSGAEIGDKTKWIKVEDGDEIT